MWKQGGSVNDIPLLVRASSSLPYIFDPVMINGQMHLDGGIGANFPLNVFGNEKNVVGMRFRGPDARLPSTPQTKDELGFALLEGFQESTTREHAKDADWAQTIVLDTSHSGTDLFATVEDVEHMIEEGERSVDIWLNNRVKQ